MNKGEIIEEILNREWKFFKEANNIGGRAECQDNKIEFITMRKSQWETLPLEILESYLCDLEKSKSGINLIVEKYARMMEFTDPEEYKNIEKYLTKISNLKREITTKIMEIYMNWEVEVIKKYPKIASKGRPLYSSSDTKNITSIETYLRGELYSYSEKTLSLYYNFLKDIKQKNRNLAMENIENIVLAKGYKNLEEVENKLP